MGSKKGKGRQAGGFASKAMRAQFRHEWLEHFHENQRQQQQRRNIMRQQKPATNSNQRPKVRLASLRNLLAQRDYEDRIEYRAMRIQQARRIGAPSSKVPQYKCKSQEGAATPGWILSYQDLDCMCPYLATTGDGSCSSSLQSLSLKALALALPDYLEAWGYEPLRHALSLLPGPALTALSVLVSTKTPTGMTDALLPLFKTSAHHPVERLCIIAPPLDEETDDSWKALTDEGLLSMITSSQEQNIPTTDTVNNDNDDHWRIPDSWEDLDEKQDEEDPFLSVACRRTCYFSLTRLELGNLPHVSSETVLKLLRTCSSSWRTLTHLGLSASLGYESGPEVLWNLLEVAPHLRVLDVSCCRWITEGLLRGLWKAYESPLLIRAVGTALPSTTEIALELEFGPTRFWTPQTR